MRKLIFEQPLTQSDIYNVTKEKEMQFLKKKNIHQKILKNVKKK